jgi:hypothetical protein
MKKALTNPQSEHEFTPEDPRAALELIAREAVQKFQQWGFGGVLTSSEVVEKQLSTKHKLTLTLTWEKMFSKQEKLNKMQAEIDQQDFMEKLKSSSSDF